MGKESQTLLDPSRCKGYDVSGGSGPRTLGMLKQQLSSKRELVEQLDSEPLLSYLVQNGVLDDETVDEISKEKSPVKANLALLKKVEDHGKAAEGLLLIALRQTGQHYLANLLDDSDRIKALSGSGYLSKSRHKGQLNLKIQIRAIKLSPESFKSSNGDVFHTREWVSLDDLQPRPSVSNGHDTSQLPSVQQFQVDDETYTKDSKCFCACFAKLFSKSKGKSLDKGKSIPPKAPKRPSKKSTKYIESSSVGQLSLENMEPKPQLKRASSEKLRNLENVFRQKCSAFFALLEDMSGDIRILLLKYFEQERGLLVLDVTSDSDAVTVMNICTTTQQFQDFRQDYGSGKLLSDIEKWIVTEDTLAAIGAKGLKLSLHSQQEDFDLVEQELS